MKSISASIVVLAGSMAFALGGLIGHSDTSTFVMLAGGALAVYGLVRWHMLLKEPEA